MYIWICFLFSCFSLSLFCSNKQMALASLLIVAVVTIQCRCKCIPHPGPGQVQDLVDMRLEQLHCKQNALYFLNIRHPCLLLFFFFFQKAGHTCQYTSVLCVHTPFITAAAAVIIRCISHFAVPFHFCYPRWSDKSFKVFLTWSW